MVPVIESFRVIALCCLLAFREFWAVTGCVGADWLCSGIAVEGLVA